MLPQSTRSVVYLIATTTLLAASTGCQQQNNAAPKKTPSGQSSAASNSSNVPAGELVIGVPSTPQPFLNGKDLRNVAPAVLAHNAFQHALNDEYRKATRCQYWVVKATNEGRYNLACWECLAGNIEAALYWLREAARLEGSDSRWAQRDSDLEDVRTDPRWPKLLTYLKERERHWRAAAPKRTVVIVPAGYDRQKDLPLVVWLHGMGGGPENFQSMFQRLANKHQIGFVGVSGTVPRGKTTFAWADVADEDFERIRLALADVKQQVRWREGTAVALGFSQGAIAGVEVAVRHPEMFAGVITISAGSGTRVQLDSVTDKTKLPRQGFVIVCGDREYPSSVARSNLLARWLKTGNANVLKPAYPNHAEHHFPEDFEQRFPEWLAFIERARKRKSP